jgi:hypothetical protein
MFLAVVWLRQRPARLASWQTRLVKSVRDATYELATCGTLVGSGKLIFLRIQVRAWRAAPPPPLPRNIKIGKMIGKLGNLLMFLAVVWLRQRPACLPRNSLGAGALRRH